MPEILTARQMRDAERAAIDAGKVTGLALMEHAGIGVVDAIESETQGRNPGTCRCLVLCGPGNNGGDGFVVARHLADRGWAVDLHLMGEPEALPPEAAEMMRLWRDGGRPVGPWRDLGPGGDGTLQQIVVVDAVFGIGQNRACDAILCDMDAMIAAARGGSPEAPVLRVAVDLPTGLCADSGRLFGERVFTADVTVTFHRAKVGHYLDSGPAFCGTVRIVDIGL